MVAVAMVVVAEGAVWLLRPREAPIEPAPVAEADYFSEVELERARDFRRGQLLLLMVGVGAQGAVLAALALGRPAAAGKALKRLGERPLLGAAVAGAGLSVAVAAVALPADLWRHERAVDVGLSVQSLPSWLGDAGKSVAIGAGMATVGAVLLMALLRRFPRSWPAPAAMGVVGVAAVLSWLAPVVLAPLFNRFEPLPEGSEVRHRVLDLAGRAEVDVGEVYRVDASRRVTALNAYVGGLGPTKRVVLYDTLIDGVSRPELESVVAHELGHVSHDDIPRGLAFVALVAPLGLLFAREAGLAFAARSGAEPRSPAALPGYAVALALASLVLSVPGNQLSRRLEASADQFALRLTGDPRALIDLQQRLAEANLSDPDPPDAVSFLLGTHPSTVERIGAALAFERERGDAGS
jgi:STE24 endopeptidase